jgi:cyclophilin family peptidyl-prolyl cis-trans isomerase
MAPLDLMPHAVHLFLEQVSHRLWDDSWFYLNGPHVLQAGPQVQDTEEHDIALENGADERELALKPFRKLQLDSMAFSEYSDQYPHKPWTLGYTGRPGGPDFYINKVDNTRTHGPGGQVHHDLVENADPCFAKVVDGMATLDLITKSRTIQEKNEFQYFFDEPIEIIRVRVVPDPFKPKVEEKAEEKVAPPVAVAWQRSEDSQPLPQQNEDPKGSVEVTHGDVVPNQQQQQQQQVHDEGHSDPHQMHRHRKHPHADFLPNESVEA